MTVAEELPNHSAYVIGRMNLVNRVRDDKTTIGDMTKSVLSTALRYGWQSKRIDVVFDTYKNDYIKNSERVIRRERVAIYYNVSQLHWLPRIV